MTVADLIVRRLRAAGVVTLFGMPGGGSNLDLIDAAGRVGLPFVLTATETGAAIATLAQTEITGRLGACLTTLGPGVSSVVNGVACAYLDRAPVVVLTDCHPAGAGSAEHQRLDHRALLAPVTKWSATLSAENADDVVSEAIARALTGTPGPVHIDVPSDVVGCRATFSGSRSVDFATLKGPRYDAVVSSNQPLLLVGLGARRSDDVTAIRDFCAAHRVPALVTYKAKGVVPDDDPHFGGVLTNGVIERQMLERADLFVGVGLDSVELLPRPWTYSQPMVSIIGSIAEGLARLSERLTTTTWNLDEVRERVAAAQRRVVVAGEGLTPDAVVATVARVAQDVRVTVDAGAHMFPATMLWPVRQPNGMLISNGLSTMGFALPAAIGAALVDRERVIALTGDGGLLMCAGELLTAARERLRVITIVFSDASLSLIAIKQRQRGLTPAGVALGEVAWCALAESLGVTAHVAESADALETALAEALAAEGPSLIETRVDPSSYADVLGAIRG